MNDRRYHDDQPGAWIWNVISKVAMWVLAIVIGVALWMLTFGVPGCSLASPSARAQSRIDPRVLSEFESRIDNAIAAQNATLSNNVQHQLRQNTNDPWPSAIIQTVFLVGLFTVLIKRYSYLVQKPKWEAMKRNGG